MASTAKQQNYDVVIVGGAVNGSATAYFLANNPDFNGSVLVIERDWTYNKSATALSSSSIRQQFSNPINIEISRFGAEFVRSFPEVMEVDAIARTWPSTRTATCFWVMTKATKCCAACTIPRYPTALTCTCSTPSSCSAHSLG